MSTLICSTCRNHLVIKTASLGPTWLMDFTRRYGLCQSCQLAEANNRIFDLLQQGADGQSYKEAERYLEKHAPELYSNYLEGTYMRELVISRLRDSSWYSNLFDECEGSPPLLESYTDTQLLDMYVQHC